MEEIRLALFLVTLIRETQAAVSSGDVPALPELIRNALANVTLRPLPTADVVLDPVAREVLDFLNALPPEDQPMTAEALANNIEKRLRACEETVAIRASLLRRIVNALRKFDEVERENISLHARVQILSDLIENTDVDG